jgi:hypothetical protein
MQYSVKQQKLNNMGLEKQMALMMSLSNMGEGIPGLDPTAIINNIIEKSEDIAKKIDLIQKKYDEFERRKRLTKEEVKEAVKKEVAALIDKYVIPLEKMVNDAITEIKSEWKAIKKSLAAIPDNVSKAIANILTPPAIGVPPVAPNPLYALNIASETKDMLQGLLNAIATSLVKIIKASNLILFELPDVVIQVGETIKILDTVISTIPV